LPGECCRKKLGEIVRQFVFELVPFFFKYK
jgi:hypothetical protein